MQKRWVSRQEHKAPPTVDGAGQRTTGRAGSPYTAGSCPRSIKVRDMESSRLPRGCHSVGAIPEGTGQTELELGMH